LVARDFAAQLVQARGWSEWQRVATQARRQAESAMGSAAVLESDAALQRARHFAQFPVVKRWDV